jgi:subtilisin family serine protease
MKKLYLIIVILLLPFSLLAEKTEKEIIYQYKNDTDLKSLHMKNSEDINLRISQLKTNNKIAIAEENFERSILGELVNDKLFPEQWYLQQASDHDIDIKKAWKIEQGDKNTVIAVIDTGVDIDHPDLVERIWENSDEIADNGIDDDHNGYIDDVHGWDFVHNNNDPNPDPNNKGLNSGVVHGTHVAGIIVAQADNGKGVVGICRKCRIMPVQVMNDEGVGKVSSIYNGILYAVNNGADIINLSFGNYDFSSLENEAVKKARAAEIIVVAAVGNDGKNLNKKPIYPACYKGVLGVAATNKNDLKIDFSNYGSNCVDISAPGSNILSTYYTEDLEYSYHSNYGYMSGTSMAAPIVASVAGLLKSFNKNYTEEKIKKLIINNAEDVGLGNSMGKGRINARLVLKAAKY